MNLLEVRLHEQVTIIFLLTMLFGRRSPAGNTMRTRLASMSCMLLCMSPRAAHLPTTRNLIPLSRKTHRMLFLGDYRKRATPQSVTQIAVWAKLEHCTPSHSHSRQSTILALERIKKESVTERNQIARALASSSNGPSCEALIEFLRPGLHNFFAGAIRLFHPSTGSH